MYKDKEKQREANRLRQRRFRAKNRIALKLAQKQQNENASGLSQIDEQCNARPVTPFITLCVILVLSSLCLAAYSGSGSGTADSPYLISDYNELCQLRTVEDVNVYWQLAADINAIDTAIMDANLGWCPVSSFSGSFNGAGHTISHLKIARPTEDEVGFIGYLAIGGVVANLGLAGVDITGDDQVGGLCGYAEDGSISKCYTTGSISGDTYIGGICGYINNGAIINSYSLAAVTGITQYAGGAVGRNTFAEAGKVNRSYAAGAVSCPDSVGGFSGMGAVVDCYYDTNTTGQSDDTGKGTPKTTVQMMQEATFVGWDFSDVNNIWAINEGVSYPYFQGGDPLCTIPNIVGQSQADANSSILIDGFVVGAITTDYHNTIAVGYVISYFPVGDRVCGSDVNYVVSLGRPEVPDIVDMLKADANSAITAVDSLTVGTITVAYSDTIAAGKVISSNPVANTEVDIGSAVSYTASLGVRQYSLTVTYGMGGTATGSGTYTHDTSPNITATAYSSWRFINWTGTGAGSVTDVCDATTTILMDANYAVKANFATNDVNGLIAYYKLDEANDTNTIIDSKAYAIGLAYASLTTTQVDANDRYKITAKIAGTAGNNITFKIVRGSGFAARVNVGDVNIILFANSVTPYTSVAEGKAAFDSNGEANSLATIYWVKDYDGSSALSAAYTATALTGGTDTISSQGYYRNLDPAFEEYRYFCVDVNEQAAFCAYDYNQMKKIHVWGSNDGYDYKYKGCPYTVTANFCGAPSAIWDEHLQKYLCFYGTAEDANHATSPNPGWWYGNEFGICTIDKDLGGSTFIADINVGATVPRCWAPEPYMDTNGLHVFVFASTGSLQELHPLTAYDYNNWSTPKALGISNIDPFVVKRDSDPNYYMFYHYDKYINVAASSTVAGTYTNTTLINDWAGWWSSIPGLTWHGLEGHCILNLGSGKWLATFQPTLGETYWSVSEDNWGTWSAAAKMTNDSSQYSLGHGTLIAPLNLASMHSVSGQIGNALSFNGTTDYIDTGQAFESVFQDSFSISGWFKATDGRPLYEQDFWGVMTKYDDEPNAVVYVGIDDQETGKIIAGFAMNYGPGETYTSLTTITDNAVLNNGQEDWHFVAITVKQVEDNVVLSLYFDGVLQKTATDGGTLSTWGGHKTLYVGGYNYDGEFAHGFSGSLDDIRIYDRALTAGEVLSLYYSSSGRVNYGSRRRR